MKREIETTKDFKEILLTFWGLFLGDFIAHVGWILAGSGQGVS